ncbi:hypothetical protein [Pontibacter mangrovi]|uniref:MG2 domain-containing protein n=1 Tax=Pontibacter mangrovi TaxID=2589816 RepID=A0A501VQV0_9BACT|nr:hypothetical protein [Pontibacter mangrovi]TPE39578.1 hypothetical protein FJM65_20915 [Pontibacter mangrovi]
MNSNQMPHQLFILFRGCARAVLCLAFCLATAHAFAQQVPFASINKAFEQHRNHALQEKLFLHIDRPVYVCGETMWFKVYNVDGTRHQPLDMSKVAYVEVLDAQQKPVLQGKIGLKAGLGNGSFILPATLASGNYTVRAYTNWMKNFSPDFYFEQPVTIINTFQQLDAAAKPTAAAHAVRFFPEGGNLVAGVANKVAFQATEQSSGKGLAFTGILQDQQGDTVAEFSPHKFGIGHFTFTPATGSRYTAVITLPDSSSFKQKLPVAQERGYALQLQETPTGQLKLTVWQQGELGEQLYLLAHTRQAVAFSAAAALNQGAAVFLVDKAALADGITHFTVFNESRQPVCERLYFKSPAQSLQLNLATNKPHYGIREKVTLDLQAQLPTSQQVPANLSLAVYRLDSLQKSIPESIESYLWLTSDLRGTVENPGYYFSEAGATDQEAMDNLMLTHGWSRFAWQDVLAEEPARLQFLPEYNGHRINGRVTLSTTGAPAPRVVTYLASPGKRVRLYNATSDAEGLISFEMKDFFGDRDIVVQSDFTKDSTYHFEIFSPFSDMYGAAKPTSFNISEGLAQALTLRHVQAQVRQAYFGKYINRTVPPAVDSLSFYGQPDEQYLLDDYKRFKVMEEVMREYVPGVQVRRSGGKFRFMVFNRPYKGIFQNNPMVLLDGVPVFDIDKIMAFDPLKVRQLDVITSRFFNGPMVYEGLVSYTTYKGDLAGFELNPKALLQAYEGVQLQREFYAPAYDTPEQRQSRLADLRNLLHWQPNLMVETGKGGQVDFYTSDQQGEYLVVVQGMTESGLPGSQVTTFRVEEPLTRK